MNIIYEDFMKNALLEAHEALKLNEVPIGAIIVYENKIIGRGKNMRNSLKNSLMHAEIIAIDEACKFMDDWRLEGCTMFVTVEPCPMCAGAILQSRIDTLVFGCFNKKAGSAGSLVNLLEHDGYNHKVNIISGVLEEECSKIMSDFFRDMRSKH
ncbi:MAG: tRNA adenosine(34) deaminase TadA [Defluviitaleaceae bacterium]|nr:tRNA adenosine(34) deaminase TadA [Defluviitaleaceae bacterium]